MAQVAHMTKKLKRSILIGMILGDGCCYSKTNNNRLYYGITITHCTKQLEYLKHKSTLLENMFSGDIKIRTHKNGLDYIGHTIDKGSKKFRLYRKLMYPNGKKKITRRMLDHLTPEGIAIWYMDDGSLCARRRNGKIVGFDLYISTYVDKEENQIAINYFKEKWGVNFSQGSNKGWYRLRCGTKEAKKFAEIITPYIIPSMAYKVNFDR